MQGNSGDIEDVAIGIYDGTNPIYFEGNSKLNKRQLDILNSELSKGHKRFIIPKEGGASYAYTVTNEKSHSSDWHILGIKALTEMEEIEGTIIRFTCIMLGIAWGVIILLFFVVSQSILGPLQCLVQQFKEIGEGSRQITLCKTKV